MAIHKFEIPPRSRRCDHGNEEFKQGMSYFSVLEDGEKGEYLRKDYCVNCWEKNTVDSLHVGLIYWKSSVPTKKAEPLSSRERDEKAMDLLKQIYLSEDQEEVAEAFVLALFLARNKKLILKKEIIERDGQTILLHETVNTEEMIAIRKIGFSSLQKDKIQQSLTKKLSENCE